MVEPERLTGALDEWARKLAAIGGRPYAMAKAVIREAQQLAGESETVLALHDEAFKSDAFVAEALSFLARGKN